MANLEIKKWDITISTNKKWFNIVIWWLSDEKKRDMFFELPSKIDTKTTPERLLEICLDVFKKYNTEKK